MSSLSSLHTYYKTPANLAPVRHFTLFDGGGYDGIRTTGFTIGGALLRTSSNRIHAWWGGTAISDPGPMKTRYAYSDDGAAFSTPIIFAEDVTNATAWGILGNSALQLASGRVIVYGSTSDADGTPPWAAYYWYSDNPDANPPTWNGPNLITALAGTDYWAPHGTPVEVTAGGEVWMPWYGLRTGDANYSCGMMKSTDHGFTWSLVANISAAITGIGLGLNEPVMALLNGTTEILVLARTTGQSLRQMRTLDGGATWLDNGFLGVNATVPTFTEPCLYAPHDVPGDLFLFQGLRNLGGSPSTMDASLRYGLCVSRSKNNGRSWGEQVLLVPEIDGRIYPSACYGGLDADGQHTVTVMYSSDFVNVDVLRFRESLVPAPIT